MAYEIDNITLSQKIFYYLLCHGALTDMESSAHELYRAYVEREEVMNLVKNQAEVADCRIERYGSTIYLMPDMDNQYLGFTKAELKKEICRPNATDKDYYLSQFVILTLLVEFYDGQGASCKSREFLKLGELQNLVSQRLQSGAEYERKQEEEDDFYDQNHSEFLDFTSMQEAYEALKSTEAGSRSRYTKEGFVSIICDFLDRQGLIVFVHEDEMIKTTPKLDHMMEFKILNKDNYENIMKILGAIDE